MIFRTSNKRLGFSTGLNTSLSSHLSAMGTFTTQMTWPQPKFREDDLNLANEICLQYDKNFYVHADCKVHLGKVDSKPVLAYLNSHLKPLDSIPGSLIVHIGKGQESSLEGIKNVLDSIYVPEGKGRSSHKLILENAAGAGYEKGKDWNELYEIFRDLNPRIGLCIDTQHSFGSGMIQFGRVDQVVQFFSIMDNYFPGRLQVIHLNDSGVPFGSRVDSHGSTRLGEGHIWGSDDTSLKYLLAECYRRQLDLILETGDGPGDLERIHNKYYNL